MRDGTIVTNGGETDESSASTTCTSLGAVQLLRGHVRAREPRATLPSCGCTRDTYDLVVPIRGSLTADWAGRRCRAGTGELFLHDTPRLRTLAFDACDGQDTVEVAGVAVPKALLGVPVARAETVLGRSVPGVGVGAVLSRLVTDLAGSSSEFGPKDGPRLGLMVADLLTALIANLLESEASGGPESAAASDGGVRRRELLHRIQSYVLERLADPELDARSIAAAHHISLSYLYRLFEDVGTPVAAWIRQRRLDRARRDLADPALAHVPIHRIGARWGFCHATDFSRAFRSAYGITPSAFRRHHDAPWSSTPTG